MKYQEVQTFMKALDIYKSENLIYLFFLKLVIRGGGGLPLVKKKMYKNNEELVINFKRGVVDSWQTRLKKTKTIQTQLSCKRKKPWIFIKYQKVQTFMKALDIYKSEEKKEEKNCCENSDTGGGVSLVKKKNLQK